MRAPIITSPANDARISSSTPTIQGTAEPGVGIKVFVDGISMGDTIASQA